MRTVSLPTRASRLPRPQAARSKGRNPPPVAADHGEYALLLAVLQQSFRSWPFLLLESAFEASLLVAVGHPPNGLRLSGLGNGRQIASQPNREDFSPVADNSRKCFAPASMHGCVRTAIRLAVADVRHAAGRIWERGLD
jgi:hypothetical protein